MEKIVLPLSRGVGVAINGKLCISLIDENGNKRVGGEKININEKLWKIPVLRAFLYFFYGLFFYFKSIFLQNEIEENGKDKNKSAANAEKINLTSTYFLLAASLIAMFLFGFLILGVVPAKIFNKFFEYNYDYYFRSFMIALFRFVLIYAIFAFLRFMPFMSSLYAFNGAGNLFLAGKGQNYKTTNYPLNFLNFMLNVFAFSTFVISLIAVNISWIVNFVINLTIFALFIPIIFEFLRFASNCKWGWIKDLTLVTDWLVTIKPNITHKEVLLVAKRELENFEDFEKTEGGNVPMSAVFAEMSTKLNVSDGVEQSDIDWIVATVLDKNRAEVKLCRFVTQKQYREIMRACQRRAKGEPLSSIFGFVEFYGLRFEVNRKVLSPRMDTEILVEEVIKRAREEECKTILDLCTGSGAIAVSLAKYTDCKIYASDISKQALVIAEINAKNNEAKVEFSHSDLTKGLKKGRKYDIIVSNPPYIKSGDIEKLDIEVKKYDPRLALDGGEDGLDFYRRIAKEAVTKLNKKGWLYLEIGKGQGEDVAAILQENGFENVSTIKDYNKIERVVYGRTSK